jgi:LacI family transcriptional regulator
MFPILGQIPEPKQFAKRRQIYNTLVKQLQSGRLPPATKLPDIEQMSEHFSVSYATMHAAVSDLVRDGLLVTHRGKGIFVADRGQRERPTVTSLVLVLPVQKDIVATGMATEVTAILHGCSAGASESGAKLGIHVLPSSLAKEDFLQAMADLTAYDGVIFYGAQYESLIRELGRQKFPVAMVNGNPTLGNTVNYDRSQAVRMATRHLLDHGYRRIACFEGYAGSSALKFPPLCEEIRDRGITEVPVLYPCETEGETRHFAQELLAEASRYDAVFVDNFLKARQLIAILRRAGVRVPEDLAVMGFGIEALEQGEEAFLSHMAIPYHEMARETAIILDLLVRGRAVGPVHKILQAHLEIRRSCGCGAAEIAVEDAADGKLSDSSETLNQEFAMAD